MRDLIAGYEGEHLMGVTADRRRTAVRILRECADQLDGNRIDADSLRALLDARQQAGYADSTLRKSRAVVLAFALWMWRARQLSGDELLALRDVRLVGRPARETTPKPYRPRELRQLRAELDGRWPKFAEADADRWLRRYRESRSPYSRIRSHVIRCQLDAIIGLALHLGLRRREIRALSEDEAHLDNDHIVVWGRRGRVANDYREVPYTDAARAAMSAWLGCRRAVAPDTRALWLNLHAAPTSTQPITATTFEKLLGTYLGPGWELRRLRDTCAAGWIRTTLPLHDVRRLLGLARIEDVLPHARLVGGSLEGRMVELDEHFCELVGPVIISDIAA